MDLGFKKQVLILFGRMILKKMQLKLIKNIGNHIVLGDITKIDIGKELPDEEEVDLVIGGFPCQGFQ